MRRISAMTLGFVLIFVGLQLHLVDTFVLTPRFSNLLSSGTTQFDGPQVPMNFNHSKSKPKNSATISIQRSV